MLSMSLAQRITYLERDTHVTLGTLAWPHSDSLSLWAAEHIMELHDVVSFGAFAEPSPLPNRGLHIPPVWRPDILFVGGRSLLAFLRSLDASWPGSLLSNQPPPVTRYVSYRQ